MIVVQELKPFWLFFLLLIRIGMMMKEEADE